MSFHASNPDVCVCFTILYWSPQGLLEHIPTIQTCPGFDLRGEKSLQPKKWISLDDYGLDGARDRKWEGCYLPQLSSSRVKP